MRIFVTGATGFVGSAIVRELITSGHQVLGLARSDAGAKTLATDGRGRPSRLAGRSRKACATARARRTPSSTRPSTMTSPGSLENCAEDRRAIEAMGAVLEGSGRPMLVTSGFGSLAPGRIATEADMAIARFPARLRGRGRCRRGTGRARLRRCVWRRRPMATGDHGFVPRLIAIAREKGVAAYVGDGQNRWPGVHRLDAARLYRLALEQGVESGPYHAVADEGVPFKAIAEVIGRRLGVPVVSKTP